MGIDIGRMAVTLTANANQFVGTMSDAEKAIFKARLAYEKSLEGMSSAERAAYRDVEAARKGAAKEEAGGLKASGLAWAGWKVSAVGAVAGGLADIGGMMKSAVGAMADGVGSAFAAVQADAMKARSLALSVGDLRAARHWAGPAAGQIDAALGNLSGKFTDLHAGSAQAARDFAQLSRLSGVGMDKLQGGKPAILDAIAAIPDASQRAAQAFVFLKGEAGGLLDQFEKGGMAKSQNFVSRLGMGATDSDLAAVKAVARAWQDIQATGTAFYNQVMLGLAPVAAEIAAGFGNWKVDLTWVRTLVQGVAESLAGFVGLIDQSAANTQTLGRAWDIIWAQAERGWHNLEAAILAGLARIADKLRSFAPKAGTWGPGGGEVGFLKRLGLDPDDIGTGLKEYSGLASLRASQAGQKADDLTSRLAKDLAARARPALPPGPAAGVNAPLAEALTAGFAGMTSQLQLPAEQFRQTMTRLGMMDKLGIGDAGTRALLAQKAGMDLLGAAGMGGDVRMAGAAEANSREAYSTLARFANEGKRGSLADQVKAGLDLLSRLTERRVQQGDDLIRETGGMAKDIGKVADVLVNGGAP